MHLYHTSPYIWLHIARCPLDWGARQVLTSKHKGRPMIFLNKKQEVSDMRKDLVADQFLARWTAGFLIFISFLLAAAISVMAQECNATKSRVPEAININTQAMCPSLKGLPKDVKDMKGFKHAAHADKYLKGNSEFSGFNKYADTFTCAACHSGVENEEEIFRKNTCEMLGQELNSGSKALKPKDVFHKMCLKCHKNMKKAGKSTGPVSCKGCHTKK